MSLTVNETLVISMDMYAKIFSQIFDSSIAENCRVRHVFEDLLKLADKDGCVDMTVEAVSRRTNVPLDEVREAIGFLMAPDEKSRSKEQDGRRLVALDTRRDWGWIIVNYAHYRAIQDQESLRENWRNAKAKQRARPRRVRRVSTLTPLNGEQKHEAMVNGGASPEAINAHITASLPAALR